MNHGGTTPNATLLPVAPVEFDNPEGEPVYVIYRPEPKREK